MLLLHYLALERLILFNGLGVGGWRQSGCSLKGKAPALRGSGGALLGSELKPAAGIRAISRID